MSQEIEKGLISFRLSLQKFLYSGFGKEHPKQFLEGISKEIGFDIVYSEPSTVSESWFFVTTPFDTSTYSFLYNVRKEDRAEYYGADAIYNLGMLRVKNTLPPERQKFPIGSFVYTKEKSPAKVEYTYSHAFGGDNIASYCLKIKFRDGLWASVSWFQEKDLVQIVDEELVLKLKQEIIDQAN